MRKKYKEWYNECIKICEELKYGCVILCSLCVSLKDDQERLEKIFKEYCVSNNLDFEEKWNIYHIKLNANKWIKDIGSGKPTFITACDYLNDDHLCEDFESACAFALDKQHQH